MLAMVLVVTGLAVPPQLALAAGPTIGPTPSSGATGTTIVVTGRGFTPRTRVQLTWDGKFARLPSAWVNRRGTLKVTFTVPAGVPGRHRLGARKILGGSGTVTRRSQLGVLLASAAFTRVSATPATSPGPGFVYRDGTKLLLDGRPFRFTGLNIYNANGRDNCAYSLGYDDGSLGASLDAIGSGQEAFRAWFFQDLATTERRRDWSAFDRTLSAARTRGLKVIVTLADQWGACDSGPSPAVYKSDTWYRTGYRSTIQPGSTQTYRDWVAAIVTRYRDDPAILAWQLMNEAEVKSSRSASSCSPDAATILKAWATDVARLVKSIDSRHLLSLGTMGGGQCGAVHLEYKALHDIPQVDLCEYHDYSVDAMPGDEWNGLAFRLKQCAALDKPLLVGEVGMKDMPLGTRGATFEKKFRAQFAAGVVGILPWAFIDAAYGGSSVTDYNIGPADPVIDLLMAY